MYVLPYACGGLCNGQNSKSAYLAFDWIYTHSTPSVSLQSAQIQTHISFALGQVSQSWEQGDPKTASKTPITMEGKIIFHFAAKIKSRIYKPTLLYPSRNRTQLRLYINRRWLLRPTSAILFPKGKWTHYENTAFIAPQHKPDHWRVQLPRTIGQRRIRAGKARKLRVWRKRYLASREIYRYFSQTALIFRLPPKNVRKETRTLSAAPTIRA